MTREHSKSCMRNTRRRCMACVSAMVQSGGRTGSVARRLHYGLFEDRKFPSRGIFRGWMRRIFVNTVLAYLRKNDVLQDSGPVDGVLQIGNDEASAIDKMAEAELLRCIGELPDGYRTVLNLFAIEGYSHKEIAEMLHISEGTSRSQYLRPNSI